MNRRDFLKSCCGAVCAVVAGMTAALPRLLRAKPVPVQPNYAQAKLLAEQAASPRRICIPKCQCYGPTEWPKQWDEFVRQKFEFSARVRTAPFDEVDNA